MDDFYEDSAKERDQVSQNMESLTERLKEHLPVDQHELLYRWEAECAENCGGEVRQFASYVAGILMTNPHHDEKEGGLLG